MAVFFKKRKFLGSNINENINQPKAFIQAKDSIQYTSGINNLDSTQLNQIAFAISNNQEINHNTEIIYYEDNVNQIYRKISIGDSIFLGFESEFDNYRIIGFNHDYLYDPNAYGSKTITGKAGITFEFIGDIGGDPLFFSKMQTSYGDIIGWTNSYCRSQIYNMAIDRLQSKKFLDYKNILMILNLII